MKLRFAKWLWSICLLLLGIVCGAANISLAFAYDGPAPAIIGYDAGAIHSLMYDGAATLLRNAHGQQLLCNWTPLSNFSDFLAADGGEVLAGSIRNVNPTGGTMNCVNCSIATDATLAGNPASALSGGVSSIRVLENTYGGTFQPVSGQMQIGSILSQSGNGARGIVYGESLVPGAPGHVFNVLNNGGTVQFLDGQIGGSGLNNLGSFQNFQFLLTHPGTP